MMAATFGESCSRIRLSKLDQKEGERKNIHGVIIHLENTVIFIRNTSMQHTLTALVQTHTRTHTCTDAHTHAHVYSVYAVYPYTYL